MADLFSEKTLLTKRPSPNNTINTPVISESGDEESSLDQVVSTVIENEASTSETSEFVNAKEALKDKVVCLFFSASWCAPCHHFVPLLRDVYTELVRRGDPLEVVFISFDKSTDEMMDYYKNHHGNWLALPFEDPFRDVLAERYSINMVPKLIVIQPDGEVITTKGRKDIQDKGVVCMRGWHAALNLGAGEATTEDIQEEVS